MKITGSAVAVCLASLALAVPAAALAQGKPRTTNEVPTDCARLSSQQAKDECVRAYNQKNRPDTPQGATQGTGVGKGQGQGQGMGQGSGQGATHGVGQGNKKPK